MALCGSDDGASSDTLLCAERRLLARALRAAARHGATRPYQAMAWLRRKGGGEVQVERRLASGTPGCSVPCERCRRALERVGLVRVRCTLQDGSAYRGRLP